MICSLSHISGFWDTVRIVEPLAYVAHYITVITLVFLAMYIYRNSRGTLLGVVVPSSLVTAALAIVTGFIVPFFPVGVFAQLFAGMSVVMMCLFAGLSYIGVHVYLVKHAPSKLLVSGVLLPIIPLLFLLGSHYLVSGNVGTGCYEVVWGPAQYYVYAYMSFIGLAHLYALWYARAHKIIKKIVTSDVIMVIGSLASIGMLLYTGMYHIDGVREYSLAIIYILAIVKSYGALSGRAGGSKLVSSGILIPLLVVVLTSFVMIDNLILVKQLVVVACALVLGVGYVLDTLMRTQSEYEEVLTRQNTELIELNKNKNEFLSFATHQLKAPLTSIKWGMGSLRESKLDPNQDMIANQIVIVTNQMVRTVTDFLNSAKLESGQLSLNKTPVELSILVQKVINEFQPLARGKQLELRGVFPPSRLNMEIDEPKLEQVIANLIDNAIKYTPKGAVTVTLVSDEDNAYIKVSDTGAGMAHGEAEKLFQKYKRGSASVLNSGGSGIGLYLGKQIVELHGGALSASSKGKDKGSEFVIQLPLK